MNSVVHTYNIIQVRPRALLLYPHFERLPQNKSAYQETRHDITKELSSVKGVLSPHARKRLKRALNLLVAQALEKDLYDEVSDRTFPFKINFITLELPSPQGDVTDDQLKRKCLNEWLLYAKRKYGLKSYVWKAETQENGNLHFHLTTDCYIHWSDIRKSWNHSLRHFGFVDQYEQRMKEFHSSGFQVREDLLQHWDLASQKSAYEYGMKTNWRNPNCTDVHAVNDIDDLAGYMIKYMSKKEDGRRQVQGKIWSCSTNLTIKDKVEFQCDDPRAETLMKAIDDLDHKVHKDEHFHYLRLTAKEFARYVTGVPRQLYEELLQKIRDYEYTRNSTPEPITLTIPPGQHRTVSEMLQAIIHEIPF